LYEIDVADHPLVIRVDRPSPALDALLAARGVPGAVLITAYNPRSRRLPEAQNAVAHGKLIEAVRRAGKDYLPTRARDPVGDGPTEAGLLVLGLAREDGVALARRFDQYAIVWMERGQPPVLVLAQ